ncbi:MAG TPA: dihydrofolate reductase family protein [Gaiellaceae bacterium]|nr:dihydrofolate reductase family protein [Gaiellaceae bacterium]
MRKVVAYELLSLDGVAEDPQAYITDWDDAMDENLGRVVAEQDAVLLGRRTWDDWAAFWPGSDIEPFATFINGVQKYVVTSTPLAAEWGPTTVVDGDLGELVADLKGRPGGDIGVHGSIALTQALLERGLVDELRLVVAPAVLMRGRRLFERAAETRLTLTRNVASSKGYLLLDYTVR